jgi:copper chaperone CopZ
MMIMSDKADFKISGMHCTSCAKLIEMTLEDEMGVRSVSVEYPSGEARVEFDPALASPKSMQDVITSLGYGIDKESA